MEWGLKYGEHVEWYQDLLKDGEAVPHYENRPQLLPRLIDYWEAFWAVSTSRPIGMGIGFIPYNIITEWMDEPSNAIPADSRKEYRRWINYMDGVYMAFCREQRKSKEVKK